MELPATDSALTSSSAFTRRNPTTGFQAECSGLLISRRIRSRRRLLGCSIVSRNRRFLVCERIAPRFVNGLAVLWPGQRGPIRSRVLGNHRFPMVEKSPIFLNIVTGLLPGSPVASAVTLSTTVAVCNGYHPVYVGLILTEPTAVVRASERRRSVPRGRLRLVALPVDDLRVAIDVGSDDNFVTVGVDLCPQ